MKLILLVEDSSDGDFYRIVDYVSNRNPIVIDTTNCDKVHEYRYLLNNIKDFSQSEREIMLARFSGRESIIRNLGDECSDMILSLSNNKKSKHYTECPINIFENLVRTVLDKETN